jgi:hypothetical protein
MSVRSTHLTTGTSVKAPMILYGDLVRSFLLRKYHLPGKRVSWPYVFPNLLSRATMLKKLRAPGIAAGHRVLPV